MRLLTKMTAVLILSSLSSVTFATSGNGYGVWPDDNGASFFDWIAVPAPQPSPTGNGGGVWPTDKD